MKRRDTLIWSAALIGLALEKLVFERLEEFTVVRWGMLTS